jgi:hypothetical protein
MLIPPASLSINRGRRTAREHLAVNRPAQSMLG